MNFPLFPSNDSPSWHPSTVQMPLQLKHLKGPKWPDFGPKWPILQTLSNFSKTMLWIFLFSHEKNHHHDILLQCKCHFDWIILKGTNWPEFGPKWQIFLSLSNFSKSMVRKFSSFHIKRIIILTSFRSANVVLIEAFWMAQNGPNLANFVYFLDIFVMNFPHFTSKQSPSWHLHTVQFLCWFGWIILEGPKWPEFGQNWPILQTLSNFSKSMWWIFLFSHQINHHHILFKQCKCSFELIILSDHAKQSTHVIMLTQI